MRPFQTIWLTLLLAACAPALLIVDPGRLPRPQDWDPKSAQLEWWHASGWVEPYAFHFAFFKAYAPPSYRILGLPGSLFGPFHAAHLALTDLRTGKRCFLEAADQDLFGPRGETQPGPRLHPGLAPGRTRAQLAHETPLPRWGNPLPHHPGGLLGRPRGGGGPPQRLPSPRHGRVRGRGLPAVRFFTRFSHPPPTLEAESRLDRYTA